MIMQGNHVFPQNQDLYFFKEIKTKKYNMYDKITLQHIDL